MEGIILSALLVYTDFGEHPKRQELVYCRHKFNRLI